jgi:hypothetical protein
MENNEANSFDKEIENVQSTNSQTVDNGTQENDNSKNATVESVASAIDYQKKFSESSKEALRILDENKIKDAEIARLKEELMLKGNVQDNSQVQNTDNNYPGFENLDEETQNGISSIITLAKKQAVEELKKDPAYAFALRQNNETTFNNALQETIQIYPELAEFKDEFKAKHYNVNNVPVNIKEILVELAKGHLFDKAKQIGAREVTETNQHIELERTTAGKKDSTARRSLEDWTRMQQENPQQFLSLSKEFNADMESGKI